MLARITRAGSPVAEARPSVGDRGRPEWSATVRRAAGSWRSADVCPRVASRLAGEGLVHPDLGSGPASGPIVAWTPPVGQLLRAHPPAQAQGRLLDGQERESGCRPPPNIRPATSWDADFGLARRHPCR